MALPIYTCVFRGKIFLHKFNLVEQRENNFGDKKPALFRKQECTNYRIGTAVLFFKY